MRRSVLAVLLVAAVSACTFARGSQEPKYADQTASWWVGEYVSGDDPQAARNVLQRMGDSAAPQIAAALSSTKKSAERCKLLELLEAVRNPPESVIAAVRPSLASSNSSEQLAALRVVARAGGAASGLADDVAALLESRDPEVRQQAATTLGALGDAAVPHVPALVALLDEDGERWGLAGVAALGRIGPRADAALPRLLEFAAARPPHLTVVRALNSIGPDDVRVAGEIVRAVETGDQRTRESVLPFLREPKPAGAAFFAAAERLAGSTDEVVRMVVADGLGHAAKGRTEVPETLFVLLRDDDIGVVGHAANALQECGPADHSIAARVGEIFRVTPHPNAMTDLMLALRPQSGPALIDAALSDSTELRQAAWYILVRTGDGGIAADADHVKRLLFDSRVDVSQRARLLSLVLNEKMLPAETELEVCAALVTDGEPSLAARAAHALKSDAASRDALITAAARTEPVVRAAALAAMIPLVAEFPDVLAACVRAVDDPEPAVRAEALNALQLGGRKFWADASESRDLLASRMPALARDGVGERRAVIAILSDFPDAARPAEPLVAMLAYDDVVEQAIGLLRRTPADPSDLLRPLLSGDDPLLAVRAARVGLVRKPDADVVAKLTAWIESGDPRVAHEATIAAAELPTDTLVQLGGALVRAARSGVEGVAWPACHALARISGSEPAARDALLAVADDPHNSAQIAVAQFLPALGEPGISRLVAMLDHPARDGRRNACTTIVGAARNRPADYAVAVPALERLAKGDDLELARLAEMALKTIRK